MGETDGEKEPGKGGGVMDEFLKPGDPCPCCGMPIKTEDPDKLLVLNWLAWVMGMQKKDRPVSGAAGQD